MIQRYVSKISGPLPDRTDIHIEVPAVKYQELRAGFVGGTDTGDCGAAEADGSIPR
jgi:magnesium chelatase family protein